MDLKKRVSELERYASPANNVPVSFSVLRGGDETKPYCVEYQGNAWIQLPDESLDQFKERAAGLARLIPTSRSQIFLCAMRPDLPREEARAKWMEAHHGPDWKTIVGAA